MLEPSHIRLILRAFSFVWYFMCGLIAFVGLAIFTLSLATILNFDVLGDQFKMDSGLQMLGISVIFIVVPIGFIFFGRSCFRPVLAHLEEMEKRRQTSPDSDSSDTNHPSP